MIIYKATNILTGDLYIGKTIKSLKDRKKDHNYESNNPKTYFHRAFKKYKPENFTWEVIFECLDKEEMNQMEKFFIANYRATNNLYNLTKGGDGCVGYTWTDKQKKEQSIRLQGNKCAKGSIRSEEQRKNQSEKMKGRPSNKKGKTFIELYGEDKAKELKDSHSKKLTGKKYPLHSNEWKEYMSEKMKGNKHKLGYKFTEEEKERIYRHKKEVK